MYHNDNLENGMTKFWEKVYDDESGEAWEREVPACHCSECDKAIYEKDDCGVFLMAGRVPYILCEDCIDGFMAYGKDGAQALVNYAREQRRLKEFEKALDEKVLKISDRRAI